MPQVQVAHDMLFTLPSGKSFLILHYLGVAKCGSAGVIALGKWRPEHFIIYATVTHFWPSKHKFCNDGMKNEYGWSMLESLLESSQSWALSIFHKFVLSHQIQRNINKPFNEMSDSKSFRSRISAAFLREQRRTEPGWCWPGQRESSPGNPWRGATAAIKGRGHIFKDMWFSAAFGLVGLATDVVSFLFERGFLRGVIISKQVKDKAFILPSFYFIFHFCLFCYRFVGCFVSGDSVHCKSL